MLLCMTDLLGLLLSTILVLWIELIESALEHLVDILRYINVYVLLLLLIKNTLTFPNTHSYTHTLDDYIRKYTLIHNMYTIYYATLDSLSSICLKTMNIYFDRLQSMYRTVK